MITSRGVLSLALSFVAAVLVSSIALAADPGLPYPESSEVSDQKAGSVLFYNTYTSSATAPSQENTRINITNTNADVRAFLHIFFVEGRTCSIADTFICFTRNQTVSFETSDADPGTQGYIVAFAVNNQGRPIRFDFFIGDEYVKYASGHHANLAAEAIAAPPPTDEAEQQVDDSFIELAFDGKTYNRLPRVLADDSIPSRLDGNDTKLIVNRVGGDLRTGAGILGTLFGVVYDDAENTFSTSFIGLCHLEFSIGANNFPRVVGGWNALIPAGHTGWMKFWSPVDFAILGAAINFNPNLSGYNGGHNLHKLTLSDNATYILPVFPASC